MTNIEFQQTIESLDGIIQGIRTSLAKGKESPLISELNVQEFDRLGSALWNVRESLASKTRKPFISASRPGFLG